MHWFHFSPISYRPPLICVARSSIPILLCSSAPSQQAGAKTTITKPLPLPSNQHISFVGSSPSALPTEQRPFPPVRSKANNKHQTPNNKRNTSQRRRSTRTQRGLFEALVLPKDSTPDLDALSGRFVVGGVARILEGAVDGATTAAVFLGIEDLDREDCGWLHG
jgi:hypothetical protein